jgi:IMP cyclohydrolase
MYVGRIAAVARGASGRNAVLYRVSSRSFPNRVAVDLGGRIAIVPRPGHEGDVHKNPYIAYNCLRIAGRWAVATNGSHTDPIAEKIEQGVPPRDALAACMLAMDYEKDQLSTPRIAALAPLAGDLGWLAIVRRDALIVREVALETGRAWYVATYEHDDVRPEQRVAFDAPSAAAAARQVFDGPGFASLEKPVTSAAALAGPAGFELAIHSL